MSYKNFILLTFILLLKVNVYSQEKTSLYLEKTGFKKIDIKAKKDTIQIITSSQDSQKPKPTILFLQGSTPMPVIFYRRNNAKTILPFDPKPYLDKYNFVIIARKGVSLVDAFDKDYVIKGPKEYELHNNLKYRTFQADETINYLYKQKWVKKDSIFVVGHSEGSDIGAKVSENNNKMTKLVCMSSNAFSRSSEYVFQTRLKCLSDNNDAVHQSEIDLIYQDFKNIDDNIEIYRNEPEMYNWASYEKYNPYQSLQKFKRPLLVTYGSDDTKSLYNDLLPFLLDKTKLTLKVYPDYDHNYFKKEFDSQGKEIESSYHWDEVFADVVKWIEK
ncbi:MAG: acyl-CoA thioester hydrolase/BAAT C-terminal domain-containing protein [Flavobacterium sp.]